MAEGPQRMVPEDRRLAQTPWFGVCDFPKGPGRKPGHLLTTLGERCLRQIADVKKQRLRQPAYPLSLRRNSRTV